MQDSNTEEGVASKLSVEDGEGVYYASQLAPFIEISFTSPPSAD